MNPRPGMPTAGATLGALGCAYAIILLGFLCGAAAVAIANVLMKKLLTACLEELLRLCNINMASGRRGVDFGRFNAELGRYEEL